MIAILAVVGLVANPSFAANRLASPPIMGRGYWTLLDRGPWVDPTWQMTEAQRTSALAGLPVFREAAVGRGTHGGTAPSDPKVATWRTVAANMRGGEKGELWRSLEANAKPDTPLFFAFGPKRYLKAQVGKIDLDYEDFRAWCARHPNLFAMYALDEWENDVFSMKDRLNLLKTQEERDELVKRLYSFPPTRAGLLQRLKAHFDHQIALHYGATNLCLALRHTHATDHMAAAWGVRSVLLETTCTTSQGDDEFRWDVHGMFARGAARQFDIPWGWYVAIYYNGWTEQGKFVPFSVCWYDPVEEVRRTQPYSRPEGGVSASLFNRVCWYAYLNGCGYLQTENWKNHLTMLGPDGIPTLTPRGKAFSELHDFNNAHPGRGEPYAPVAILTPFDLGYSAWGGVTWRGESRDYTQGDCMVDGVFFTIVPGRPRGQQLRRGIENCLHNSPYAMMYDVLVPDSPQPPEKFLERLKAYPVAFLTGQYPDVKSFWPTLGRYVREGGTLLVNRANVPEPTRTKLAALTGTDVRDGDMKLATAYDVGRGRLIVSASDWMSPPVTGDIWKDSGRVLSGQQTFPEIACFLKRFQEELFPFRVRGSCQYGVNRTKGGWWLWALNNDGVTKFVDAFEKIDGAMAHEIVVDLKGRKVRSVRELLTGRTVAVADGTFAWTVPAGGVAVFEVAEN